MNDITVNGATLRDMFSMGGALLEKNKAAIDALNVFPVPDGDTGTNMSMTVQSALKEMKNANAESVGEVAAAAFMGSLKGARGNSGVILSQIFRGFSKALAGAREMDAAMLANALQLGTEAAYKAVMKPKEGTMLTVSRVMAQEVMLAYLDGANVYGLIDTMIESGERILKQTPDLLPVLKEAGVVDSGGKGLLTLFRGFKMALDGEELDDYVEESESAAQLKEADITLEELQDITYGYCTEFIIIHLTDSFEEADVDKLRDKLMRIGDSIVVAYDSGIVKCHVHTNSPGKAIQFALRLGELERLKIENMREQNRELQAERKRNEKECAMIAVSAGAGIDEIFRELGVAEIIEGGQTMNPSIDTIGRAIRRANARNVFVLPNNSNIILAAQQAAELAECNAIVIQSKSIQQGISAAMAFMDDADVEKNAACMVRTMESIISGAVTYAVRDTSVNGSHISKGDMIGLMNNEIVEVSKDVETTSLQLLHRMIAEKSEDSVVTIFYGEGLDESHANALVEELQKTYSDAEFIVQEGGQPLYYYYFSVE